MLMWRNWVRRKLAKGGVGLIEVALTGATGGVRLGFGGIDKLLHFLSALAGQD
jgi:hypothetical protein